MNKYFVITITYVLTCFFCIEISAQNKLQKDSMKEKFDDYSNRNNEKRANDAFEDFKRQLNNTIVVINNKIYTLDSEKYKFLNKRNILNMQVIKDDSSKLCIKNIIIITTR